MGLLVIRAVRSTREILCSSLLFLHNYNKSVPSTRVALCNLDVLYDQFVATNRKEDSMRTALLSG